MPSKPGLDLSVGIIAYNEEKNISRCLQSIPQGAEVVVVLDEKSTDQTESIASDLGAKIFKHSFSNFAEQKNVAIEHCTRGWVLMLDCDEELDLESKAAIAEAVTANDDYSYRLTRRLSFQGKLMRYGKTTDHPLRMFKRGYGRYENEIHEQVIAEHPLRALKGHLVHYSYRDLDDYFARFNRYTALIAKEHVRKGRSLPTPLFHLLRPLTEFIQRYFLRLGFLDGRQGYVYALISSLYAFVKYEKLIELKSKENLS